MFRMPVSAESRLAEVAGLLDLMEKRGVLTLRVGDIELTRLGAVPSDEPPARLLSNEEKEAADRARRRKLILSAGSQIVGRVGE